MFPRRQVTTKSAQPTVRETVDRAVRAAYISSAGGVDPMALKSTCLAATRSRSAAVEIQTAPELRSGRIARPSCGTMEIHQSRVEQLAPLLQ